MTREEAHAALDEVGREMHSAHGAQAGRLEQLDSHLSTASMVVDHLFDESEKAES